MNFSGRRVFRAPFGASQVPTRRFSVFTSLWFPPAPHLLTHLLDHWLLHHLVPSRPTSWQDPEKSEGCQQSPPWDLVSIQLAQPNCAFSNGASWGWALWAVCPATRRPARLSPGRVQLRVRGAGHSELGLRWTQHTLHKQGRLVWGEYERQEGRRERKIRTDSFLYSFISLKTPPPGDLIGARQTLKITRSGETMMSKTRNSP